MNSVAYISSKEARSREILLLEVQFVYLKLVILLEKVNTAYCNPRSCYVSNLYTKRKNIGAYEKYVKQLRRERNAWKHHNYFRMSYFRFNDLHSMIAFKITKKPTHKYPISTEERVAITLRFLASGDSGYSIAHAFDMSPNTVYRIVYDTCDAIWEVMQPLFLPHPDKDTWSTSAQGYWNTWNYPNCIGAIDGKHVQIKRPRNAYSKYFNYKKMHSIVLMAVVGPKYEFLDVDIGAYGRNSDGGIFSNSNFGRQLQDNTADLPDPSPLPNTDIICPYHMVGDEAFPLKTYLMRPFPGRNTEVLPHDVSVFNYRLSRARRTSENVFGIWSGRFRIFRKPIDVLPENVDKLIKASVVLHNYLIKTSGGSYAPRKFTDNDCSTGSKTLFARGAWRQITTNDSGTTSIPFGGNRYTKAAGEMRNSLKSYFVSPQGRVSWQDDAVDNS